MTTGERWVPLGPRIWSAACWLGTLLALPLPAQEMFFPDGVDRVEIPLQVLDYGDGGAALLVDITIGDVTGPFLFDTGATFCIDGDFADRAGIAPGRSEVMLVGISEAEKAPVRRVPLMRIGDLEIENVFPVELDLDFITGEVGLFGIDAFGNRSVEIDPRAGVMVVHAEGTYQPPKDAVRVDLQSGLTSIHCRAGVGGPRRDRWMIDTGNMASLVIHAPFGRRQGYLEGEHGLIGHQFEGVFGAVDGFAGTMPEFWIGDMVFRDFPAFVAADAEVGSMTGNGFVVGNIGLEMLMSLRCCFDGATRSWYLYRPEGGNEVRHRDTYGLAIYGDHEEVYVYDLLAGSPGAEAIELYDTLLQIDDWVVGTDLRGAVERLRASDEVEVTVSRDGESLRHVLKRRAWLPRLRVGK